jgi:hypothetical protein
MKALGLWYVFRCASNLQRRSHSYLPPKTDVLVGLNAKQPKAVAGCILALKEAVR